jgi:glycerol-1-phosphate dehydrogenase [NAD(P)+]
MKHSSKYFSLLEETLNRLLPQERVGEPTVNIFSKNRHELMDALKSVFSGGQFTSLIVVSDGVSKKSGCDELSIDELVAQCLALIKIPVERISIANAAQCRPEDVHASIEVVQFLKKQLGQMKPSPVLVVGSGSATDVVKHALCELNWNQVPFVSLPTALTVTAFTSHFAVLEEAGAKRTRLSRRVDFCLWFAPVLASAPLEMTRAGYGDLLARFVAYGDWYLAWRFGIADRYDELAWRLMEPFAEDLKVVAPELRQWPVANTAMERLSAILAMAGIAMSVSGETTPLSGYEHTISHALDYLRLTGKRNLCWHGEQVALASLASAQSFDELLSMETISLQGRRLLSDDHVQRMVSQLLLNAPYFGPGEAVLSAEERKAAVANLQAGIARAGEIFSSDYLVKHRRWASVQERCAEFEEQWSETRRHLRTLVISSVEMRDLLEKSGLPTMPEELSQATTAQEFRWAIRFSPFVRGRASLADIIFWMGEDPAILAAV